MNFFDNNTSNIPTNLKPDSLLADNKNEVVAYYNDLCEESDFIQQTNSIIKNADAYLDERLKSYPSSSITSKLAIVLDIDETSLSNYFSIKADNFTNDPVVINTRYHKTDSPAITPVLRLHQKAIANNVHVFFITARKPLESHIDENLQPYAVENLLNVGYKGWDSLYLPKIEEFNLPTATFKTNIRKQLTEKGYDIVLNIGDQDADLQGGYAEQAIKVPNLLYGTHSTKSTKALHENSHSFFFQNKERERNENQLDNTIVKNLTINDSYLHF